MSYIVPVSGGIDISNVKWAAEASQKLGTGVEAKETEGSFKSMLKDVIGNVIETENQTKVDAYNLSIGNMDSMHDMMINEMKAEMALQTMVQLRNKLLDAYKEVMNTNL